MVAVALMTAMSAQAQKLQTVDKDGQPVPYVTVIGEDGNFIGTTDLDGVLSDVKGAEVVTVTHVAYKSKKVQVGNLPSFGGNEGGLRVTLEDADFDLPEITVTKKPLVYVQTYYRMLYVDDDPDNPLCYYRSGVLNNSYDRKTKKTSIDEDHLSASNIGIFKTALNTALGPYIKRIAGLKMGKVENRMKQNYKAIGLTFTPDGPGKQVITDKYGTVGTVVDNDGERRYSYDTYKLKNHLIQTTGSDKKKAKAEKRDNSKKNRVDQDYTVYRIDEQGNYSPEDFIMAQGSSSYDSDKAGYHVNILLQVFTTDRAYVDKDGLKQLKKENKMKMNYQNLLEFERAHKIPALSEQFQKRIKEIVK